ncbi:MAG: beta-aspartyl-peptidase (threonine type) [Halieaceae bacterium]|jgi:beta-aspartyl-peptidase (threonine type)
MVVAMTTPLYVNSARAENSTVLVIHGGAGTILKQNMTTERETLLRSVLSSALLAGRKVLLNGGQATDAVVAAIAIMEDSPEFNAGKGAVFTHEGVNEMDASLMDGSDLDAGAVAGVSTVKNPIVLAREVMKHSPHVMLSGSGAEVFASERDVEQMEPEYFRTERRWKQLQRAIEADRQELDHDGDNKFGTVGAVALDVEGNLAAGTSTGGMTNKRWNRIGDSPIIGAGTYADNASCAISATGHGEYFIRATVARTICALVEYSGLSIHEAAQQVIHQKLSKMGGEGGVIGLDREGNATLTFNTAGMYRGYISMDGEPQIAFYEKSTE